MFCQENFLLKKNSVSNLKSEERQHPVPINIAEGCGRDSLKDFAHFIHIAEGSASELECELIIAVELGFITDYQATPLIEEISQIQQNDE